MGMIRLSASARRGLTAGWLAAAVATAAGCGSSGSAAAPHSAAASPSGPASASASATATATAAAAPATSPPAGAPTSRSTTGSGLAACATANLSVGLQANTGGGAAGSQYVPITFTNTSGTACAMYGFPGVSFVTGPNGSQIGAPASRQAGFPSVTVVLAAHATAHAWLQVAEAGNYPTSTCQPVTAHWLKVYPPANTAASYIGHTFTACSSAKVTLMKIDPVRAGLAVDGQVP
jgi:Protein of unknown function (DUF4232)